MSLHNRFWALADLGDGDESTDEDDGNDPFEDEKGEIFGCDEDGHHEHYEIISNGIFDWDALDEVYGFMDFGHGEI